MYRNLPDDGTFHSSKSCLKKPFLTFFFSLGVYRFAVSRIKASSLFQEHAKVFMKSRAQLDVIKAGETAVVYLYNGKT